MHCAGCRQTAGKPLMVVQGMYCCPTVVPVLSSASGTPPIAFLRSVRRLDQLEYISIGRRRRSGSAFMGLSSLLRLPPSAPQGHHPYPSLHLLGT